MDNFLKIGEVAKKFKITTRTLRFYEQNNLFKPCKIDANNYRLYSQEQLDDLRKILILKDIGMDLRTINEYLTSGEKEKRKILVNFNKKASLSAAMSKKIIKDEDFDLKKASEIINYGNMVGYKKLSSLCGVWLLDGIYKSLHDAQKDKNKLDMFTPYTFLAFDENGNSPWFYNADDKKINFNTFYMPASEIYQIKDDRLYIQIINPKQHIFVEDARSINFPHILVFKLYSKNYEDYKNFLHLDTFEEKKSFDKKLVGCWQLCETVDSFNCKNPQPIYDCVVLIVKRDFSAMLYSKNSSRSLIWTENYFFNEVDKQKEKYKIENEKLIVENKTKIYTYTGKVQNYFVFTKIKF